MPKKTLKTAIYSGEIPSTTFVERLIIGLTQQYQEIYLFGIVKKKPVYPKQIRVFGYKQQRFLKALYGFRYYLLLSLFKRQDKKRLDIWLKQNNQDGLYAKVKCYPILWHQPDVFHIQWAKGLDDWMWVQQFGMKLVLSLRGAHINYSPIADLELARMYKKNFPMVDGFHAVSKAIGIEAIKYGADSDKIHTVYSGLDFNFISQTTQKPKNKKFKIISVGRPHWVKGYTYALDACKLLKDTDFEFEFTIIGGADAVEYQYQVSDLGLEDDVQLFGQQDFQKVQDLIQEADLLLMPSLKEGIANVVLEAMALETLVLTTDCGGMMEVIKDGQNGFIVPIRDSEQMAEKIKQIMKMPEEDIKIMTKKALETVSKQHNEKQMITGMQELYESVMKEGKE